VRVEDAGSRQSASDLLSVERVEMTIPVREVRLSDFLVVSVTVVDDTLVVGLRDVRNIVQTFDIVELRHVESGDADVEVERILRVELRETAVGTERTARVAAIEPVGASDENRVQWVVSTVLSIVEKQFREHSVLWTRVRPVKDTRCFERRCKAGNEDAFEMVGQSVHEKLVWVRIEGSVDVTESGMNEHGVVVVPAQNRIELRWIDSRYVGITSLA